MKKNFIITFFIFCFSVLTAFADPEMRNYSGIELPAGTFVPIISLQEFSTLTADENTPLQFRTTNDIYMFDSNIIPKGSTFYGRIEKKNEPILGTNGSMVVRLTKLEFTDGYQIPVYAYIYTTNGCLIGGEMTAPAKYDKIPHYHKGICWHYLGVLRWVPGPTLKMGEHVTIASGASLLAVFKGPAYITHSVEN